MCLWDKYCSTIKTFVVVVSFVSVDVCCAKKSLFSAASAVATCSRVSLATPRSDGALEDFSVLHEKNTSTKSLFNQLNIKNLFSIS